MTTFIYALCEPGTRTVRYIGVTRIKKSGRWVARISFKGNLLSLGCFSKEDEAARAYDIRARFLFGMGAKLNFPI